MYLGVNLGMYLGVNLGMYLGVKGCGFGCERV